MQIKKMTIYGVQALQEFAKGEQLPVEELAKRLDISISYATSVIWLLKKAGLIEAHRGTGYGLTRDWRKKTVADLVNVVDEGFLEDMEGDTPDMKSVRKKLRDRVKTGLSESVSSLL